MKLRKLASWVRRTYTYRSNEPEPRLALAAAAFCGRCWFRAPCWQLAIGELHGLIENRAERFLYHVGSVANRNGNPELLAQVRIDRQMVRVGMGL